MTGPAIDRKRGLVCARSDVFALAGDLSRLAHAWRGRQSAEHRSMVARGIETGTRARARELAYMDAADRAHATALHVRCDCVACAGGAL